MKIVTIHYLFFGFYIYENIDHVSSDKIFSGNKLENLLQKYVKPIKRISEQFPNREIELQVEIDGNKARILSAPKKPPKYIRLHKSVVPITRSNIVSGINTSSIAISIPEPTITTSLVPSTISNTVNDPEQMPVSMAELKKVIEEYDKVSKYSDDNQPLLKRDLWIALGMKYGLKCNDSPKQTQSDVRSEPTAKSSNIEKLLQILKDGEVVKHNPLTSTSNENLHWFKIKIPKEMLDRNWKDNTPIEI